MAVSDGGGNRTRGFQDAVSYAVGHRIRVEILAVLHERDASANELARMVGQPLSTVTHHVGELLKAASIEVGRTERVRSVNQHFYRVAGAAFMSDDEVGAISEEARQEISMMVLQALTAEALAAFWNGKLTSDPRVCLLWSWFNVDGEGREEIADEQARSWSRICAIRDASDARRAESGEEAVSILVSALGFERCRTAPGPPCRVDDRPS
jgi:DNA-binding transcriptional ArsR family regulator